MRYLCEDLQIHSAGTVIKRARPADIGTFYTSIPAFKAAVYSAVSLLRS